jgi:hypothetical protein
MSSSIFVIAIVSFVFQKKKKMFGLPFTRRNLWIYDWIYDWYFSRKGQKWLIALKPLQTSHWGHMWNH